MMLVLVLTAWIGARAALWESPFPLPVSLGDTTEWLLADQMDEEAPMVALADDDSRAPAANPLFGRSALLPAPQAKATRIPAAENLFSSRPGVAAGHQMLLMAAMGHLPMPRAVEDAWAFSNSPLASVQDAPGAGWSLPTADDKSQREDRWSVDAWAFWREGSNSALISQGRVPVYGASQAGAVLQYRLAPRSGHDPRGYLRGYRALVSNGESEGALGVSARPLAKVPLRVHAEARLTDGSFDTEVRGAAFITTELPAAKLPLGARAELYAQGGYVSGDAATPFVDGQLHLTREVAKFDLSKSNSARLSVGGAGWAGAQDGVHRVDLGPSARVDLTIGQVPARISVDWRERVAGDAAPSSGVAATLSTRF